MSKDASKMGSGLPEYLLLFRKPPTSNEKSYADEPVTKDKADYTRARWQVDAHSFWRSNGNTPLTPAELYDYEAHIERLEVLDRKGNLPASFFYEPPKSLSHWVWDDVVYMRTLNTEQSKKRQENHICPLPFDIVERTIRLYSNEGDLVLDPFAGLFTVPVIAMKLDRVAMGIELNTEYYQAGVRYCEQTQQEKMMPTLFDYMETAKATG
jgi:DNA modification methylase